MLGGAQEGELEYIVREVVIQLHSQGSEFC